VLSVAIGSANLVLTRPRFHALGEEDVNLCFKLSSVIHLQHMALWKFVVIY